MKRYGTILLVSTFAATCLLGGCSDNGGETKRGATKSRSTSGPHVRFTASNNPTTLDGRGEPSLEDRNRPAAWIFVDGKSGRFVEKNGEPMMQWVIEEPVSPTPTFRVEVYEPLVGNADGFKSLLQASEGEAPTKTTYAIRAEGEFAPGKEYSLTSPGENFIIINYATGDLVTEIAPLEPGKYAFAGSIENQAEGKKALAITYFTVADKN